MLSNSTRIRFIRIMVTASLLIILFGCAMQSPVSDSERDRSGKYDGFWVVKVEGREGQQFENGVTLSCNRIQWRSSLYIVNGKGTVNLQFGKAGKFNIGSEGSFSVTADTNYKWSSNEKLVVNLKGKLSESTGTGYYTIGRDPFYGAGCRYKTKFSRNET